ncbi:conserved hypothetical protein [Verticillium alfalfae VaMs.102]|uniref:60S ribosomal protein L19 n=1 Tax=Verticillium alfalfae (strain VaMs.102 / ATCC MYA-4576 / FGSC 10136) TaxID=526221 RepID=C9S5F2_VERA1|nr:conserved hypothetical protein [Verticillium alfalfae VaMs.102]EEY14224.1 conserved hypothetical protein [Verticillium alfalfae VaMs.102]
MSTSNHSQWPPKRPSKRNKLRNGTVIIPGTGERSHRQFTLRNPSLDNDRSDDPDGYRSLLLSETNSERAHTIGHNVKTSFLKFWDFLRSPAGKGVLKCTLAYLLGSMATYLEPISDFLGKPDGKHVVATITVYFHANRTWGSMVESVLIAFCAIGYAQIISMLSMGLSVLGNEVGFQVLSHVMILIICIGFGLGFVGWIKQRMNSPLVNVGCTLASIAIITIVTKEEAVQGGYLSSIKVVQVFKILVMGVSITALVNILAWRTSARAGLRSTMNTSAESLGDLLAMIARGFLNGTEEELSSGDYTRVDKDFKASYTKMTTNLREAKLEHYILGRETIYKMDREVVRCFEVLAQSIGGLRSAAETQFALLKELPQDGPNSIQSPGGTVIYSPTLTRAMSQYLKNTRDKAATLAAIEESEELEMEYRASAEEGSNCSSANPLTSFRAPSEIFELFIALLGPSMKSLAYTLSEILRDPTFGPPPKYDISINENFRQSLKDALGVYNDTRTSALRDLYKSIELGRARTEKIQADIEEVAAACGHFSFSLQNVAEDIDAYLTVLEDLKYARATSGHTWRWLKFWKQWEKPAVKPDPNDPDQEALLQPSAAEETPIRPVRKSGMPSGMPAEMMNRRDTFNWDASPDASSFLRSFSQWCLKAMRFLARDDIRFGIKVGLGAMLWAMLAFLPATRPIYKHWRGEWGLLSFMIVTSMTVGAANTTGTARRSTDDDDDEGGLNPMMGEIVYHRLVSVNLGILWGIVVCRMIWPISGRRKFKEGLTILYVQLGLIWRRGPLAILLNSDSTRSYMRAGEEKAVQRYALKLDALRASAKSEFELRGPFPDDAYARIMQSTLRIVDGFHAMRLVTSKRGSLSAGERALLLHTAAERAQLCDRICHVFQVLASCFMLEYPLTDAIPSVEGTKDRLLGKIYQFRREHQPSLAAVKEDDQEDDAGVNDNESTNGHGNGNGHGKAKLKPPKLELHVTAEEKDYALLYAYTLVTAQVAHELQCVQKEMEGLFGVLNDESLLLR